MRLRVLWSLLWASSVFVAVDGCHPVALPAVNGDLHSDSVRGVISIVGTSLDQRLVIRTAGKSIALVARSSDSIALARLAGVETLVEGQMQDSKSIRVSSFLALRVADVAVADGVLGSDGGGIFLVTADGRQLLGNPPSTFRNLIGARVWVGGPLDTGPNTYGIIVPSAK